MMKNKQNISHRELLSHETKRHSLIKFSLILFLFISYFLFIALKYGMEQGFLVAALTWSFFVLCTPIADAGFLIDFPLRLITNIRMFILEIFVWLIAIILNIYIYFTSPELYSTTTLLQLFKHILDQPIPFWSIILLSLIGTFVSIGFGDELMDKTNHHERKKYHTHKYNYRMILMVFLFIITFIIYDFLLKALSITIPL
jgi:hypothetical protein